MTDEEIRHVRDEVEAMREEMPDSDIWKNTHFEERTLSDLVILREGYVTLLEEYDRMIALRVAQGRFAGSSWSEIGALLGMSKQAAQQKFGEWEGVLPMGDGKRDLGH